MIPAAGVYFFSTIIPERDKIFYFGDNNFGADLFQYLGNL